MTNKSVKAKDLVGSGLLIGIAGGLAEVAVVCSYTALTGGDAASIARGIARAVELDGMSAAEGLAVHMVLAAALGVALLVGLRAMPTRVGAGRAMPFMVLSLVAVWAMNFFVVLPAMGSDFVDLLPYAVTLASKLSFGMAAAGMLAWIGSEDPTRLMTDAAGTIVSGIPIAVVSAG